MSLNFKKILPLTLIAIPSISSALPIDWHGSFGVDSTMVTDFRRIASKSQSYTSGSLSEHGTQEVGLATGNKDALSFQSYIFKLAPEVIVNDAATFKAELTTGYASGGFLGDSPSNAKDTSATSSNVQTYYNNNAAGSALNIKKAYIELNSDTGTYEIGRHSYGWGLGALYSDGKGEWDRFAYSRDGITAHYKFDSFTVNPFWAQSSNTGLTRASDAKEFGVSLLYDNPKKEIAFGLYYAKKSDNAYNTFYKSSLEKGNTTTNNSLGSTDVKVTDIYFKKTFGKAALAVEVPLLSGDLGHVDNATSTSTLSAKAVLVQSSYQVSDAWSFGLDVGDVSGHDGSNGKFGAMYLNPNFQVANLLFKYNMNNVSNTNGSIYDSYITNTQYFKLKSTYTSEKWVLDFAFLMAKAKEVAKAGSQSYNHTKGKLFDASYAQSDDLGKEFDFNAKYKWNKEVSVNTALGYLMTGDYFAFTNTGTNNSVKNSLMLQINTIITF